MSDDACLEKLSSAAHTLGFRLKHMCTRTNWRDNRRSFATAGEKE